MWDEPKSHPGRLVDKFITMSEAELSIVKWINHKYRTYATLAIAILRKPIACPTDIDLSEATVT